MTSNEVTTTEEKYLGSLKIKSIDGKIITFENGSELEIEDKNLNLITSEPLSGSDLQMKWADYVSSQIVELLIENNIRPTDVNLIFDLTANKLADINDKALAKAFGKEKLDILSSVFGSTSNLDSLATRNIRLKNLI